MQPRLRVILVFLLILAGSLLTYYYALADTPRRDHGSYLAERVLVETDWDWFWYSISYSRTRFLHPGDYFLFRPLHMAVVALKDIFFRSDLFALGAINIITMAVAAFSLYFFSSKLLKPLAALLVAFLFMVQYAGIEMVAWGHISPYLFALAFFGFAMASLLEAGPDNKAALKKAGAFLLLGALVHEMVVVALVLSVPFFLFIRWSKGKGAEIGGFPLRSYFLWVVAAPVLAYLSLDLLDYLYRGAHQLFGQSGNAASAESSGPLEAILTVAGTSAIAFLAPFKVALTKGETGVLGWNFADMRSAILMAGGALALVAAFGIHRSIRAARAGSGSGLALTSLLTILLLLGVVLGVGLGRVYSRGESYLYEASYYYSITAYAFCLLTAVGLYLLDKAKEKKIALFLSKAILVAMAVLIAVNFTKTREALGRDWPDKRKFARMHLALDEALRERSKDYCLAGSPAFADVSLRLLWKRTCQRGDRRLPGYLTNGEDGSLWLAELEIEPFGSFGRPEAVPLEKISPDFVLSQDSYEKSDIGLTVYNKSHVFLVFGYRGLAEYFQIELYGPLLHGEIIKGDGKSPLMGYVGLPHVSSPQRLELRRGTNVIHVFVDGRLLASAPAYEIGPGKIGVYVEDAKDIGQTFSDLAVTPSAPRGTEPVHFKPVAKLLEKGEIAYP